MKNNENYKLEMVLARHVRRMPGLEAAASKKGVLEVRDFARKRGYFNPVVLSGADGCMALIAGAATFEACLEEKEARVPAVIVRTEGEADNLMLALQSAGLGETLGVVAAGAAIVRLIDSYGVTRKHIAGTLGKSPAWLNRMENLSRKLNREVQKMVAEGQLQPRSAQEVARLPGSVQAPFAVSVIGNFLSKESVTYLVNRYLNEDVSDEERDRIISTPRLALPNELKRRSRRDSDNSDSARLSRAIARCLDDNSCLFKILDSIDAHEVAIRITDVGALADSLAALQLKLTAVFPRGKTNRGILTGGGAGD